MSTKSTIGEDANGQPLEGSEDMPTTWMRRADAPSSRKDFRVQPSLLGALAVNYSPEEPGKGRTKPEDFVRYAHYSPLEPSNLSRALTILLLHEACIKDGRQTVDWVSTDDVVRRLQEQGHDFEKGKHSPVTCGKLGSAVKRARWSQAWFDTSLDCDQGAVPVFDQPFLAAFFDPEQISSKAQGISFDKEVLSFRFNQHVIDAWCGAQHVIKVDVDALAMIRGRHTLALLVLLERNRAITRHPRVFYKSEELQPVLDPGFEARKMARGGRDYAHRTDNFTRRFVQHAVRELAYVQNHGGLLWIDRKTQVQRHLHCATVAGPGAKPHSREVIGYVFDLLSQEEYEEKKKEEYKDKRRRMNWPEVGRQPQA